MNKDTTGINSKLVRAKIFIIAFFLILTYFFSNDFGLIDIEKTAIVTAICVDKTEDESYEITMQIAVPEATNQTSDNKQTLVSAKGKTVGEAIGKVGSLTGWFPKLSFCNLILIGESVYKTDVASAVEYFKRSTRVQDSALIAATNGNAGDVIKNATPLDNVSSFAIQKILLRKTGIEGEVMNTDIKDFLKSMYSRKKSAFLPLISTVSNDAPQEAPCAASDNQNQNSSDQSQTKKRLFTASETVIVKNGKFAGILTPEQTSTAVFYKRPVLDSTFPVLNVDIDGKKENFLLRIIKADTVKKITVSNGTITLKVHRNINVKPADQTVGFMREDYLPFYSIPYQAINKATEDLTARTLEYLNLCKSTETDLIELEDALYRFHHAEYEKLKDSLWQNVKFEVSVNVYGQS